jgi:DNA-binding NarL/FixJ family response regulator
MADSAPASSATSPGPIRVGLVDDHSVVVDGLQLIIDNTPGLSVVGVAATPDQAFELVERGHPHILVLDISLGSADGITLMRDLLARHPAVRIVILSMHGDAETVRQALLAGAHGYVVKGARGDELLEAIAAVARGDRYLHSSVASAIIDDSIQWQRHGGALSPREREILALLAAGRTPGQIGGTLGISVATVRRHLANLATKLDLHGMPALRRYAVTNGLRRDEDRRA